MDIGEFVKARLDEDEAAAKEAASRPLGPAWDDGTRLTAVARHIARHDPARALREVKAKRKILWDHTPKTTGRRTACSRCHYGNVLGANWPCLTMTSLAGIWSDHPDFDPKWVP